MIATITYRQDWLTEHPLQKSIVDQLILQRVAEYYFSSEVKLLPNDARFGVFYVETAHAQRFAYQFKEQVYWALAHNDFSYKAVVEQIAIDFDEVFFAEETSTFLVQFELQTPDLLFFALVDTLRQYFSAVEVLQQSNTSLACNITARSVPNLVGYIETAIEPDDTLDNDDWRCMEQERFYAKIQSVIATDEEGEQHVIRRQWREYQNYHYLVCLALTDEWHYKKWTPLQILRDRIDNQSTDPDLRETIIPIHTIVDRRDDCLFHTEYPEQAQAEAFIRKTILDACKQERSPRGVSGITIKPAECLYFALTFAESCSEAQKKDAHDWLSAHLCSSNGEWYVEIAQAGTPCFSHNPPITFAMSRAEREQIIKAWMLANLPAVKDVNVMLYL